MVRRSAIITSTITIVSRRKKSAPDKKKHAFVGESDVESDDFSGGHGDGRGSRFDEEDRSVGIRRRFGRSIVAFLLLFTLKG